MKMDIEPQAHKVVAISYGGAGRLVNNQFIVATEWYSGVEGSTRVNITADKGVAIKYRRPEEDVEVHPDIPPSDPPRIGMRSIVFTTNDVVEVGERHRLRLLGRSPEGLVLVIETTDSEVIDLSVSARTNHNALLERWLRRSQQAGYPQIPTAS